MAMKKQRRNRTTRGVRRAFTLVEVILAVLITALVLGSVAGTMAQLARAKRSVKSRHEAYLRADAALNAIRQDVVSIIRADDLFYTRFLLYDGSQPTAAGDMPRDELLVFNTRMRPVRSFDEFSSEGTEYESQFRIEEDDLGPALWQRRDAFPDEYPAGGGTAIPLADGVVGLEIRAFDGEQWFDNWDSDFDGLPHAVMIHVTASAHRKPEELYEAPIVDLRTIVPIDRVIPPRDIAEAEEAELMALEEEMAAEQAAMDALEAGGAPGDAGGSDLGGGAPQLSDPRRQPRRGPGGGPGVGGGGGGGGGPGTGAKRAGNAGQRGGGQQ
jgi:type II secretory pathway pseudopilin PulG